MSDFVELRRYIAVVIRWWWLLILAIAVGAMIGYWVSQQQPRVYRASATIMVGQSIQATMLDSREIQTSEQLALTYANIARRQPVLQGVVDRLSLDDTWQRLKSRVKVAPVEGTQLLEITVEADSPEEAQVTTDEVAHQLILLSPTALKDQEKDENQRFVRQRLEDLQARIEAGQVRREELEAAMTGSLSAEQVQELQAEINTLENLIANWENNFTQLLTIVDSEKSPNYLAVVEPAQADFEPVRPHVSLNTLLAGVVGLFLALGFILLMEYLDNTLKSVDDLSQSLGLTVLGAVGRIDGKQYQDKVIASQDPFSPVSEAYRMIRSNIQFMSVDRPAKIIMVTSPTPGEGKSTTAANLGVVMAQAGLKTIIIDADLRRPTQHQIFQVPNLNGLTDLLCSPELEIKGHLKKTNVPNLHLVTCGVLPPNPSELLGSQRMGQLLVSLNELADVVIFDSPPAVAVADAAVLSNRVDGVVLVTQAGKTRREVARQAILNLQQAGANIFGGILNRVSKKGGGYYYHQYYTPNRPAFVSKPRHARPQRRWQWLPFK
ncbi:MAG: polysaccharide biosynthesis tyrosine autokinase [Chloroflexi bacterium]|nr:polysaccharide biosynthesis tyrosine autokinase [Chloroflexota bacterium]